MFFGPEQVSSEIDSFSINIIITNIGKAQGDTFQLKVTRDSISSADAKRSVDKRGLSFARIASLIELFILATIALIKYFF